MTKQKYINELKQQIIFAKKMIAKGDNIELRKRDINDMQDEIHILQNEKQVLHKDVNRFSKNYSHET